MTIARIDYGERDGTGAESRRVAFITFWLEDGREFTFAAQSCECCGGASWEDDELALFANALGIEPSRVSL